MENFRKFIKYYGQKRKLKLFGFFLLSLIAGGLEFIGIALVYPFVLLLINPAGVISTKYYLEFAAFTHTPNIIINALIIGFAVISLFILKNVFMIGNLYLQNKFINNWKLDINKRFMEYYMFSSFKNSLKSSASEKIYNLTSLTSQTLDGFVLRVIIVSTNIITLLIILGLLFIKFPIAAMVTTAFVALSMIIQSKFFRKRTDEISKKLLNASVASSNNIIESINNLKEVKILSAEEYFFKKYTDNQKELNQFLFQNNFYSSIPPYIVEILIVFAMIILTGIIALQNSSSSITIIAAYAIVIAAIFRIAPVLSKIQVSLNVINSSRDFVKRMIKEYEKADFNDLDRKTTLKFDFNSSIRLDNVTFSYIKDKPVIRDLNLEIRKGEFVGIIGLSGAGKSTLADIIMGLLPTDKGSIWIDDYEIKQNNFSALRRLIGYVPQQINILDASFKENVAWGMDENGIDDARAIEALKMAQLYDFVKGFEDGIDAKVIIGANGLSQGQKQRLAIARALYKNPDILIFDEATSALDVETEYEITQMLNGIKGEKTIVAIAHRLSTLKTCDRLVYLKDGQVLDIGTFDELAQKHADFEKMIKLSNIR